LQLKSTFGVDYLNGGEKHFVPSTLYVGSVNGGSASQQSSQNYNWLNENTITYDRTFNGIHAIDLVGGFTLQHWYDRNFSAGITGLSTNNEAADNLGIGTPGSPSSSFTENVLASYFARANYRLMDKYLFTFTMRADGSSRFGENNKWGYFPSGAFAWRVTQEKFMQNLHAVSNLKLRLSYGVTGNQEIGSYHSLSSYASNHYSMGVDPTLVVGISPSNIPNPNLKWESTASFDAGIDLGLWRDRVSLTADYYNKKTSNLLLNVNIPQSSGYSSILQNAGSVRNEGFEVGLTTHNIQKGKVSWTTTFNFSANQNRILSLGSNQQIYAGNLSGSLFPSANFKSAILLVGHPIGSFYGYVFDGIWQSQEQIDKSGTTQAVHPGDPIYKDLNGDSLLNGSDRKIIGHALPKFTYGFTSDLTVGRFNVNLFVQGVYGNKIFNENLYEIQNGSTGTNKLAYVATKSWTGPGTSNTLPSVASTLRRSTGVTSDVLESGSFLRIKSLTVSYNLPLPQVTSVFKSSLLYVTVQNLYTFTKYSGYDPEVNSFSTSDALSLGTDYNAYPNYRTYMIGVKLGF
jgi:TonB-linked SusC/RagA family outer membrane protein